MHYSEMSGEQLDKIADIGNKIIGKVAQTIYNEANTAAKAMDTASIEENDMLFMAIVDYVVDRYFDAVESSFEEFKEMFIA